MKTIFTAAGLLAFSSIGNATTTIISHIERPSSDSRTYIDTQYDVEQEHLGTTEDANGVITASFRGIHSMDVPVSFDTLGGTRQIGRLSLSVQGFNYYEISFDSRVEMNWGDSYVRYERDFYVYDSSGDIVYQDIGNSYYEHDFYTYRPFSFSGEFEYVGSEFQRERSITRSYTATLVHFEKEGEPNPNTQALYDAVNNGGIHLETQERVFMYAVNKDGDEVGNFLIHDDRQFASRKNGYDTYASLTYSMVPEPSSTTLLGLGGLALIMRRKRS